jgi:pSer/pThr/pTyr-binding forkhead associated (FHA) protein
MKVSLVVAQGAHQGKEIPIKQAQFVIGRDPECQLRPASPMISRRHCAVLVREGKVWVRDFGSTNGTQVNGQRVEGEVELHNGDTLKADPLVFTLRVEAAAPPPATKPKPAADPMEDDSIAALLLEGSDEGASAVSALDTAEGPVPLGTTVLQVPALPEEEPDAQGAKPAAPKKDEKKPVENTSAAAKLLLDKYTRRKRP